MNMKKIRLGDVATYVNGYAFKPSDRGEKGLPIIRIQDLTGNAYDIGFYDGDYPKRVEINNGDILISWSASLGVYVWDQGKALLNQHIFKVVFDKADINKYYFVYAVKYNLNLMELKAHGATMKHIVKKDFDNTLIPYPSLQEQEKIAFSLSKVSQIIDQRQQELDKLDELVKARFVEMFGDAKLNPNGYPIKALSEISVYWNGLTYKPEDVSEKGTIVLRSSNIQNSRLDFDDVVRVSCKIGEKKFVQENDVLMCSRNGSARLVGKVALIKEIIEPMSFGAFMMIIRSQYYPYLLTYFQMPAFREQIATGATTTINQITTNMLNKVKLPVPNVDTINQFANFVKQIDKSKFIYQKNI